MDRRATSEGGRRVGDIKSGFVVAEVEVEVEGEGSAGSGGAG